MLTDELAAVLIGGYFGSWSPAASRPAAALVAERARPARREPRRRRDRRARRRDAARSPRPRASPTTSRPSRPASAVPASTGSAAIARHDPADRRAEPRAPAAGRRSGALERPACRARRLPVIPDGAARFVASALRVVRGRVRRPRHARPCDALRAMRRCCPSRRSALAAAGDEASRVNPIQCVAHGMCAELLPERVTLDEWGYPIVDGRPVPDGLDRARPPRRRRLPDARAAARAGGHVRHLPARWSRSRSARRS